MVNEREIQSQYNFSIIIPALDEEGTIDELLTELENAKSKFNFEIIVSDGGSSDRTVEIAKNHADKVVVWDREHYQTIGGGRNTGAEAATSQNFVFINADTMPKNLHKFLSNINDWSTKNGKYKNLKAIAGKVVPHPKDVLFKDKVFYFCFNTYFKFLNVIGVGMGRGECQLIRKEIFEEVGRYNDTIAAGEDFDLFHRVAKKYKIRFADDIIVCESPRRFRSKGYLNTVFLWFINSVSVLFSGKSISKKWEKVR